MQNLEKFIMSCIQPIYYLVVFKFSIYMPFLIYILSHVAAKEGTRAARVLSQTTGNLETIYPVIVCLA